MSKLTRQLDRTSREQSKGLDAEFDRLLVDHQRRIYFFIRTMVFNPDDAMDVLQDVNAIILRKRSQFRPGTDFKSWTFAIARFEGLAYLKRHSKRPVISLGDDLTMELARQAEENADDIEIWYRALEQCRKKLEPDAADLLDLRYRRRKPLEEIAAEWNTSVGALKQKLFRTRESLRKCILGRLPARAEENHPPSA
jgi:RNA polymerase sigma-70 factor (ECF subfamily)